MLSIQALRGLPRLRHLAAYMQQHFGLGKNAKKQSSKSRLRPQQEPTANPDELINNIKEWLHM